MCMLENKYGVYIKNKNIVFHWMAKSKLNVSSNDYIKTEHYRLQLDLLVF